MGKHDLNKPGPSQNQDQKKAPGGKKTSAGTQNKRGPGRGRKPNTNKSSDSDSDSGEEEEPHVKDPFWDDLEAGKIDVFANDLYSKVKERRKASAAALDAITSSSDVKQAVSKSTSENTSSKSNSKN